jgi:L-ribulose-5-phosphate 3-epimerase
MQGRLVPPEPQRFQSFPRRRWRDEFAIAAAAELDTIEWIYDAYGEEINPLATDAGVAELKKLCATHQVNVESVCADWFMEYPLVRVDGEESARRWERLRWLMTRCASLGVNRIVVPFVDASAIRTQVEMQQVVVGLRSLTGQIDRTNVEIHLETSLDPADFLQLLSDIGHPRVRVNYDSGNSASLGYKPAEEYARYGGHVGSVHIKDRTLGGGTVPLGQGGVDFAGLFSALSAYGYRGDFILQVARGPDGDELMWARENAKTARNMIRRLM